MAKRLHPCGLVRRYFFTLLCLSLLSGCDVRDRFLSTEDRINAAQPPRASTERTLTLLREEAKSNFAISKPVEVGYLSRMRVRAVECSNGFQPGITTTREEIQGKLNASCLTRRDEELERWAGLLRAGLLSAKGPLRPIPIGFPPSIAMNEAVARASFADDAGIALLELQTEVAMVSLKDSAVLFREKRARNSVYGALSPNGRLFLSGDATKSSVRSTETGEALVDLPDVQAYTVKWFGQRRGVVCLAPGRSRHSDPGGRFQERSRASGTGAYADLLSGSASLRYSKSVCHHGTNSNENRTAFEPERPRAHRRRGWASR